MAHLALNAKKKRGIGLKHALDGMRACFRSERNFRIHIACGAAAVILGIWLRLTGMEWIMLILIIAFVLAAELLNAAIEMLLDHTRPEKHPAAKAIKDMSAAAVLVSAIAALLAGIFLFVPKML